MLWQELSWCIQAGLEGVVTHIVVVEHASNLYMPPIARSIIHFMLSWQAGVRNHNYVHMEWSMNIHYKSHVSTMLPVLSAVYLNTCDNSIWLPHVWTQRTLVNSLWVCWQKSWKSLLQAVYQMHCATMLHEAHCSGMPALLMILRKSSTVYILCTK